MTRRVRAVWMPAVVTMFLAQLSLYLAIRAGIWTWSILLEWHVFHSHHPLQFFIPWLLALPVIGAAGALWSRGQGGTPRESAFVALFPALAALSLVIVSTPVDLIVDVVIKHSHSPEHTFCGTAWALVSFVLAPGVALSLGLVAALAVRRRPREGGARAH